MSNFVLILVMSWLWTIPFGIFIQETWPSTPAFMYFPMGVLGYLITYHLLK